MKGILRIFCVIVFLMASVLARAQNHELDSLQKVLRNSKADTNRVNTLLSLCYKAGLGIGDYDTLFYYANAAIKLSQSFGFKKGEAIAFNNLGLAYYYTEEFDKAIEKHRAALKIFQQTGSKGDLASTYDYLATTYKKQGKYEEAIQNYQAAIGMKETEDKSGRGTYYYRIACLNLAYDDYSSAFRNYSSALELFKQSNHQKGVMYSYGGLGQAYTHMGKCEEALKNFRISLELHEKAGDKKGTASCHLHIGAVYDSQCNFNEALKSALASLKLFEEINDKGGVALAYGNLGGIYHAQGNLEQSLKYYFASVELSKETNQKEAMAVILHNIGNIYCDQENYAESMKTQLRALEIFEEIVDKPGMADAHLGIGIVYQNEKNYDQAVKHFYMGLRLFEEVDKKNDVAWSYGCLADVYLDLRMADSSIYYGKKGLELALSMNSSDIVKATSKTLYKSKVFNNEPDSAFNYLRVLNNTITRQINVNYFVLPEHEKELYYSHVEADLNLYYDFAASFKYRFSGITDTAYNMALINKGLTLKSSTAMRTSILNSGDTSLIRMYEEWLSFKKDVAKAYEGGKDTKLLDEKANGIEKELVKRSSVFNDFDKSRNLTWKQVQSGLSPGEAAIEFVHFKSLIDTTSPVKYAALIITTESIHPEMITLCKETELQEILGIYQGNDVGFANKIYGTKKEAQNALYEKIWKPMENTLKGIKTIYYSPSGLLHKISFSAINTSQNKLLCDSYDLNRQGSTSKVAIPDRLMYSSSEEMMLVGGVKYTTDNTGSEIWSYLPGTLSEVIQIESLMKKSGVKTEYLVSADANEEAIKRIINRAQIVHVATHGFFFPDPEQVRVEQKTKSVEQKDLTFRGTADYANWSFVNNKNPLMRSGLVLAGANNVWERDPLAEGEDGILTAQEVSNLDMRNTNLVVLSACETGLGDIKGSEGVYGLQRAFKMAGVKSIIMSLWQVPDKETSEFMISFYQNLTKGKDIKKAFNVTQKEMRKKYDPYYWAAFVLVE